MTWQAVMASGKSSGSDGRDGHPDNAWWNEGGWWHNSKYGAYESWDNNDKGAWAWDDWSQQHEHASASDGGFVPPHSQVVKGDGTTSTQANKKRTLEPGEDGVPAELGNSDTSEKWAVPESDSDVPDHSDYEEVTEAHTAAKALFWKSELEVRVRSAGLSAFEVHQMQKSYPLLINDFRKVISNFGQPQGPTRACRTLLMTIAQAKPMIPGQEVELDTPEFSLCKHLLVQAWAYFHQPELKRQVCLDTIRCCCLPRTALMPCGCHHKKTPLWKCPWYMNSLCQTCSTCYRCGGLLGIENKGVLVPIPMVICFSGYQYLCQLWLSRLFFLGCFSCDSVGNHFSLLKWHQFDSGIWQ